MKKEIIRALSVAFSVTTLIFCGLNIMWVIKGVAILPVCIAITILALLSAIFNVISVLKWRWAEDTLKAVYYNNNSDK